MSITLCYWNVRAMGEISRLVLRYSGVSWKDDQVPLDSTGFTRWKAEHDETKLRIVEVAELCLRNLHP